MRPVVGRSRHNFAHDFFGHKRIQLVTCGHRINLLCCESGHRFVQDMPLVRPNALSERRGSYRGGSIRVFSDQTSRTHWGQAEHAR